MVTFGKGLGPLQGTQRQDVVIPRFMHVIHIRSS